jgi:hypothetical protein
MLLRRRLALLVAGAMMLASMLAISSPASAQGGCQAFGHSVADDAKEFRPLGTNFVSGAAPLADLAHDEHALFCG